MNGTTPINDPMGMPGEWKPAWRVVAPLVIAKDQEGRLRHCYRGSLLGWLSDEQAGHFLKHNLVERIEDSPAVATLPAPEAIANCVSALNTLRVDPQAGRPAAAKALRDGGYKFSNEIMSAALRQRKSALKRWRDYPETFDEITM
jgi:hypothetical protein